LSTVVGMAKSIVSVVLLFVANSLSKLIRGNGVV
jgi:putative aldouronate transport system permease protein